MLERLHSMTTKTGSGEIVAGGGQALSSIKDAVRSLPAENDDRTIQIKEKSYRQVDDQ